MQLPLCAFTDASLAMGNDLPKTMVATAKEQGYSRVAIVDADSLSALVKFIYATKANDIGPVVGVSLSVNVPEYGAPAWVANNQDVLRAVADVIGLSSEPERLTHSAIDALITLTQILTPLYNKVAEARLAEKGLEIASIVYDAFPGMPDIRNDVAMCGSADGMLDALVVAVMKPRMKNVPPALCSAVNLKTLKGLLKSVDTQLPVAKLMFFARTDKGYKNLLSLASLRAKNKHSNIKNGTNLPLAFKLEEIVPFQEDVVVVDPLTEYSVLGDIIHGTHMKTDEALPEVFNAVRPYLTAVGLPYKACDKIIETTQLMSGIPIIPLVTAHFAKQEDHEAYSVKRAVHNDQVVSDWFYQPPNKEAFIHRYDDVVDYYKSHSLNVDVGFWDALPDTHVPLGEVHLPNYDMPIKDVIEFAFDHEGVEGGPFNSEEDADKAFVSWISESLPESSTIEAFRQKRLNDYCMLKLSMDGLPDRLSQRYGDTISDDDRSEYLERIKMEYKVIEDMGFSGYFLIEYDFVSFARQAGVPVGPGRGSAAGSLIVYCMEITDVDPIEHDLQFERFLNPERVSMPDIDVDFGDGGHADRNTVLEYISKKYQQAGAEFPSSSQIANINRYQLKSSISAARRAYGLSMTFDNALKNMIKQAEQALGISAPQNISWDELMELDDVNKRVTREPMLKKVLTMARALTGKMSSYGVHAGGVVISPTTITEYSAIECDDDGGYFSQADKDDIEELGLIKFDVLGLRTLSILAECINQIKQNHGVDIDLRRVDMADKPTYELICNKILADVFQLEGGGMRDLVGSLLPADIGEIAVLSALYRPGALQSGMVEEYIDVKHGKQPARYDHPALETVTKDTFGCIVYQEQVMSIVRELAGYSLGQADLLRRAMGKKKIEEMAKQRKVYAGRAMHFWREHYLKIGEQQKFSFNLDVNLSDLKEHLTHLGVEECLDGEGYLSDQDAVIVMMKTLLGLEEKDLTTLKNRLSDYSYVVMLFKSHYQKALDIAVRSKLKEFDDEVQEEVSKRLYYVLSQYVRFNQVFNKVEKFAGYGFNKSHAIAYSLLSYLTAYFKCHYPAEFYSAALSFKSLEKLHGTVVEATQRMGVKVIGPHVNKSQVYFSVEEGQTIRYGLDKLKGMGQSASSIVAERNDNGPFKGIFDFLLRMRHRSHAPNSKAFLSMSVTGGFDTFIPRRIGRSKGLNGRQYVAWIREQIVAHGAYKKAEPLSFLHLLVDDMSSLEFACYLTTLTQQKIVKTLPLFMPDDDIDSKCPVKKKRHEELLKAVRANVTIKKKEGVWEVAQKLADTRSDEFPALQAMLARTEKEDLTPFEWSYLNACVVCQDEPGVAERWMEYLRDRLSQPTTETLNEEREAAGFYMTSTPLKVLGIAERVEREPPSSIIDGCPVSVSKIDGTYDEQSVTTYGIVREATIKSVVKEDSPSFGEKMLFFTLENGADTVQCMIFGTRATRSASKVFTEGAVAMIAGEISMNDRGLTLRVKAGKRYYPEEDEKMYVVRR